MRSEGDAPGWGDSEGAAERPAPAFPAEALRPALVGLAGTVLCAWVVGGALRMAAAPDAITLAVYYTVVFGGLIRIALNAGSRWGVGLFRADFGWWARPTDALRGFVIMWLATMAGAVAVAPWGRDWSPNGDWIADAGLATAVIFTGFAVIAAPLFEELVFRGVLQRALTTRYGARTAILTQGAVFGLYHLNLHAGVDNVPNVVYLAVVGIVMGVAAHRYRRLGPTMAAHAFTNLLVTLAQTFA